MADCSPNIESCIVEFLTTLTLPELAALRAVIVSVLTVITLLINLLTSKLEQLNILRATYAVLLAPIVAAQAALLAGLGILPLSRIPDCIGLGELIFNLTDVIRRADPRIQTIEDLLDGIDSYIAKLTADIARYTDFEVYAQQIVDCIDQTILEIQQAGNQP